MVQRSFKTFLDARSSDHRDDLADSLPDYPDQLRVRVLAGDPTHSAVGGGVAIRHQSRVEPDFHTDPIWDAEPATGGGRYPGRLGYDYLDDGC